MRQTGKNLDNHLTRANPPPPLINKMAICSPHLFSFVIDGANLSQLERVKALVGYTDWLLNPDNLWDFYAMVSGSVRSSA